MKVHRFIGDFDLANAQVKITDQETFNQIKNVLRLKLAERLCLVDMKGSEVLAEISALEPQKIICQIIQKTANVPLRLREITLYCAILKKENFELVVQKATECGANKIVPLVAERTIKTGLKMDRLNKIIKEAAEQCGRRTLPLLTEPIAFTATLTQTAEQELNVLCDASGENWPTGTKAQSVGIFIGPEGGWTERELNKAAEAGCVVASLGSLTLRGETAAIVATYLAANI